MKLVNDTIEKYEIDLLIEWLKTYPRLTMGELTAKFEKEFAEYIGIKHVVFVNSGSSANLAMIYALIASDKLKNKNIIVPAVSWVTTVAPIIQFGLNPILCDCDRFNLGLDIVHFQALVKEYNPTAVMIAHILGIPGHMNQIIEICQKNNIILLEDTCESFGSKYFGKHLGTFGLMSSFSMYYSHQISTIEGGVVCTDSDLLHNILLSIRAHGWDRDIDKNRQKGLRKYYKIDDFKAMYTFYYPGFNLRPTDLQAKIGIEQLKKAPDVIGKRYHNFLLYRQFMSDKIWKVTPPESSYISNFAFPLISDKIDTIIDRLNSKNIESRPLVCGSIGRQPFWKELYGIQNLTNANRVHDYGFYIPNNPDMTEIEIKQICGIVNHVA